MSSQQDCPPNCQGEITIPTETVKVDIRFGGLWKWLKNLFKKGDKTPDPPQQPKDSWWDRLKKWWRGEKDPPNPQQRQQPQQQPQTRNPVLNPRANLPSGSQRLPNMNGMSRTQAESQLRSEGFTLKSTTGGGNQKWTHPDGSEVWVKNTGEVSRIPTTSAAQQFGATGKHQGVRVDADTGQIMRSAQHHQIGTKEVVY